MLVQICIFVTFILGNAYQSLLISYLTLSREGNRLKTFDQLLSSNLPFKADAKFRDSIILEKSLVNRLERLGNVEHLESVEPVTIIHSCEQLHYVLFVNDSIRLADKYYMLPDAVLKYSEKLYVSHASPLHDILQLGFDRTFETGIRQYWQKQLNLREYAVQERESALITKEEYLLTMTDICGVFRILCIGHVIASLAWLLEINWKSIKKLNFILGRMNSCILRV